MSRSALQALVALLALLALGEAIWLAQALQSPSGSSVAVSATNASVELKPTQAQVLIFTRAPQRDFVAQGGVGEIISVAPGRYDLQIVFSASRDQQTRWLENIEVGAAQQLQQEVAFDSGELKVDALVGAQSGESGEVVTYVFRRGDDANAVTAMRSGEPALVTPGSYDLRVVWTVDSKEKQIRWQRGVPVQAGLQTHITVPFQRGMLRVNAFNQAQPLPPEAVELTVYRAGDDTREVLDTGFAGTPLGLASGRYDIKATYAGSADKAVRWLRDVAIEDGAVNTSSVTFASSTASVRATLHDGTRLDDYQVYVYYYPAGEHEQAAVYAPAPAAVILENGLYDVRAVLFRSQDQPQLWLRDLELEAGANIAREIRFSSGRLLVRVYDRAGQELAGDNVFVHIHAAGARERAIAVSRSGQLLTLQLGNYDLRVVDTRSPGHEQWIGASVASEPRTVTIRLDH